MKKRNILSVALILCLLMGLVPMTALQASAEGYSIVLNEEAPILSGTKKIGFSVSGGHWAGLYTPTNANNKNYNNYIDYVYVQDTDGEKTVTFPSNDSYRMHSDSWPLNGGIAAGEYTVVLFATSDYSQPVKTLNFTVEENSSAPEITPSIKPERNCFTVGKGVTIKYENSLYDMDWIAVYRKGEGNYISDAWEYTPGESGTVTFTGDWTNTPGTYVAKYYQNNTQAVKYGEITITILPTVVTAEVTVGKRVTIHYEESKSAKDWIGVYSSPDAEYGDFIKYYYMTETSGDLFITDSWVTTPGTYTLRLYSSNANSLAGCFDELTVVIPDTAKVNADDYFTFAGVQIRLASGSTSQGLRFVVDKKASLEDAAAVTEYGMVVIPSVMLGDTRSYTAYNPSVENSTTDVVGVSGLYCNSQHTYNDTAHNSASVKAKNIFAELSDGIRYTTCITEIDESNYARYYTLRPYVKYTENGTVYVAYGSGFRSSVYEVAKAALADSGIKGEVRTAMEAIVNGVEG